jgi:hypothetical protein
MTEIHDRQSMRFVPFRENEGMGRTGQRFLLGLVPRRVMI